MLKDWLLGYYRFSAYNLSEQCMQQAGDMLLKYQPEYVIGYSVALDSFARANAHRRQAFQALKLKTIIATAERFPSSDSRELIQEVFGAPVAMEYGSIETSVLAHELPTGYYHVFWQHYFIEAIEQGISGGKIIRVTSLYPQCFPLIRYELGDEIELNPSLPNEIGVSRFHRVLGRLNDYIELPDGSRIHSETFTHVLRGFKKIKRYQIVQREKTISIHIASTETLFDEEYQEIRTKLALAHPVLAHVEIQSVERFEQSIAGKTPMVIRKNTK